MKYDTNPKHTPIFLREIPQNYNKLPLLHCLISPKKRVSLIDPSNRGNHVTKLPLLAVPLGILVLLLSPRALARRAWRISRLLGDHLTMGQYIIMTHILEDLTHKMVQVNPPKKWSIVGFIIYTVIREETTQPDPKSSGPPMFLTSKHWGFLGKIGEL